jgi:hypothetical protein
MRMFPPLDSTGKPIECGCWMEFRVSKVKVRSGEVVEVVQDNGRWKFHVLTPDGKRAIVEGVAGCRVVDMGGAQIDEGVSYLDNATNPIPNSRGDRR